MNDESLTPKHYSLRDVASWQMGKGDVFIPKLQRGLIWNPARIELLWDSLLRGIPLGTFSIVRIGSNENLRNQLKDDKPLAECENVYLLLDGQQRANAIALGYDSEESDPKRMLWIDLAPLTIKTSRKYHFYVTTQAQPWGYRIDGETSGRLSTDERRKALERLKKEGVSYSAINKPRPIKAYPFKAGYPIRFSTLLKCLEQNSDMDHAIEFVKAENDTHNFEGKKEQIYKTLKEVKEGFNILQNTHLFALVAPSDIFSFKANLNDNVHEDEDSLLALYFKRMNEQGVVPSREEIDYSILKANFPTIAFDELAKNKMSPSRLANIALRVYKTTETVWASNVTRNDIAKFCKERNFHSFQETFKSRLEQIENLLVSANPTEKTCHLLPFHRTIIAQKHPSLYQLLLIMAGWDLCKNESDNTKSEIFVALTSLVSWFSTTNLEETVKLIYDEYAAHAHTNLLDLLRNALFKAIRQDKLTLPPTDEELKACLTIKENCQPSDIENIMQNPVWTRFGHVYGGFGKHTGRLLMLYACREYIHQTYGAYDPAETDIWEDVNCPWDYDHILPQSWLGNRGRKGNGPWMNACRTFLWSIGNSTPIPFSENRSKSDDPPGADYCKESRSLLYLSDEINNFEYAAPYNIDNVSEYAVHFITTTARRILNLYNAWYSLIKKTQLLNFSEANFDDEIKLLLQIQGKMNNTYNSEQPNYQMHYYYAGKDVPVESLKDYAYNYLVLEKPYTHTAYTIACALSNNAIEIGIKINQIYNSPVIMKSSQQSLEELRKISFEGFYEKNDGYWLIYKSRDISSKNAESEEKFIADIISDLTTLEQGIKTLDNNRLTSSENLTLKAN